MIRPFKTILLISALATVALASTKLTVKELQADTKKHHNKEVTVTGVSDKFEQKTSRAGNDYFVFKLVDKADKKIMVNVYGQGKVEKPPKDGSTLEIKGTYREEKKVGSRTFKNEVQIKSDDIKLLQAPK